MKYKDYFGSVHYNDDDRVFHGKVEFIRALVSYEGTDVESLRKAFEEAVDDYLDLCRRQKTEPEKPFKGSFNVRLGPRLHQEIALTALSEGISLNQYVTWVLEKESRERQAASKYAAVIVSGQKKAYQTIARVKVSTGSAVSRQPVSTTRRPGKTGRIAKKHDNDPATH